MYLQGLWEALADEPVAPQSFARASR